MLLNASALAGEPVETASPTPESRTKFSAWIDSGMTINPSSPSDHQNFGRLFDDRSNEPLLNQLAINLERSLAPQPGEFGWGFKLQLVYGSDARFIHSLGLLDNAADEMLQPDLVEAYLNLHFSALTTNGVDLKLGKFVTLEGYETIDPRNNFFYSHSYVGNFGFPFNHTGALATIHTTSWLDVMAGVTRGVNTSLDDNNDSLAFHGGAGLNLDGGKLTISAATHIGPETPNNNHDFRYLNSLTAVWKITDQLTSVTDISYDLDSVANAQGYGLAQYFLYSINSWLSAGIRGEVYRDEDGFYVAQFGNFHDPVRALEGEPVTDPRTVGGGRTTYGAITLGINIKPPVPKPFAGVTFRPELRYDRALTNTRPFNDSSDRDQFTLGIDCIISF